MTAKSKSTDTLSSDQKSEFFIHFIDQIKDEVFLIREDGQIVFANKAASKGLHISHKKLLTLNVFDLFEKDKKVSGWRKNKFRTIKRSKEPVHYDVKWKTGPNKLQTVEISLNAFVLDNNPFILLIVHVIDARILEEQKLREAEKNKAVQTLISGAAHEFQYPIKGIYEKADALIEMYKDKDFEYISFHDFKEIFQVLANMRDQAKYCDDTIARLLAFQKKKIGVKSEFCDANTIIKRVAENFRQEYGLHHIQIKSRVDRRLELLAIDEINFEQILRCIVTNSVQSMPNGGVISLSSKVAADGNSCLIQCKDNGVGISKEAIPHVFEPFFTTKQRGLNKNSGLGLSMVRDIVKSFHGNIDLKSSLRAGTTFAVTLPIYKKK